MDMISALAGIEEGMLQSGLGQLVVDELLYQRGRPPRSRYLFKHALIQDAAYQSLLKRTRQQYHQQVAKLLEDRFPEVASTQPELVAHHYAQANCPAQAVTYWHRAGAAAASKSANAEAIDQFHRGLVLLSHKIRDRVFIWIVTARCSILAHLHPGSGGRDGRRIERGEWSAIWGLCRGARRGAGPCRSTAADA